MAIVVDTQVSCDCEDWERHQANTQTAKELDDRRQRAAGIEVVGIKRKGALVLAKTLTRAGRDARLHEVIIPAAPKKPLTGWKCKHILAVETALVSKVA